jgi:hypothetical protein
MSQIKSVNKSETKAVYTLSKDNDFFKQMTEVLVKLGLHEKIPEDFPIKLEDDEEPIDLTQKNEFYNDVNDIEKDISIIYATTKIFVIASGSEDFINDFNKYINNYFSF